MVTLKELAQITGYSTATISRVLNEDITLKVPESTRQKILEAAGELDYKKRPGKKKTQSKKTLRIGIIEQVDAGKQLDDPYYLYLKNNIERCCFEEHIEIVPLQYSDESKSYRSVSEVKPDGIIAIGYFTMDKVSAMEKVDSHIVFLDSSPYETKYTSVVPDFEEGIRHGVQYLVDMGHKKITFLGQNFYTSASARRFPGRRRRIFAECMEEYEKDIRGDYIDLEWQVDNVADKVAEYLKNTSELPTAFFTFNEMTAVQTIRALQQLGYQVPQDFSVLNYGGTVVSALLQPRVTSVSIPLDYMAKIAVDMMKRTIQGNMHIPVKIAVPSCLLEYESVTKKSGR